MSVRFLSKTLLVGAALTLAACAGGGGGGGSTFIPDPPSPPPPPPPPTCPPDCNPTKIFSSVTTSTDLAIVGYESSAGTNATLTADGFSARYDAASGYYIFDLPSTQPGKFSAKDTFPESWDGPLVDDSNHKQLDNLYVRNPASSDLQLTYTTIAFSGSGPGKPFGFEAFGVATSAGAVPTTGSASYTAQLIGGDANTGNNTISIGGTATLSFDFAGGTLAGHLDPTQGDGWGNIISMGRYDFVNTIYASGSTHFSGELSNPNFTALGSFDGSFTGPAAEELLGRWRIPYREIYSDHDGTAFGVFAGHRGP